jgi:hypothetical protein
MIVLFDRFLLLNEDKSPNIQNIGVFAIFIFLFTAACLWLLGLAGLISPLSRPEGLMTNVLLVLLVTSLAVIGRIIKEMRNNQ